MKLYEYHIKHADYDIDAMRDSGLVISIIKDPYDPEFSLVFTKECVDDWFA